MSKENTNPNPTPTPVMPTGLTHDLTLNERATLTQYYGTVVAAKARIFDLQVELEKARTVLLTAEANLTGASTLTTGAHGMKNATISPDFAKISAA